jgi:hypothetical protein
MAECLSLMSGPLEAEDDFNLTVIRTDNSLLLGRKQGGFGAGQLVLPGGKTHYYIGDGGLVLSRFGPEAARDASEETGLRIASSRIAQKGILHIADGRSIFLSSSSAISQWAETTLHVRFENGVGLADRLWLRKEIIRQAQLAKSIETV